MSSFAFFAAPDISVPAEWIHLFKAYHFVTQAVDDQVLFLRDPLKSSPEWNPPPIKKLVIVGGSTDRSLHLVDWFQSKIGPRYATGCHVFRTLVDVDYDNVVDLDTTVLSLTELDKPVFQDIVPNTFLGLRNLFESGKKIFWVTSGRLESEPYCNMTVGFGRVAVNESPDLQLQMVDLSSLELVDPRDLAAAFLRFCAAEYLDSNILWSVEPELVMDKTGRQRIPRLLPISELNDRYNSAERAIVRDENVGDLPFILLEGPDDYVINYMSASKSPGLKLLNDAESLIELRIVLATMFAIRTPVGHRFLVLGTRTSDGASFLTLISSLCSLVTVPRESAMSFSIAPGSEQCVLGAVAARLVAGDVLDPVCSGQTVVIHNAAESIRLAFMAEAAKRHIEIIFFTDSKPKEDNSRIICVDLPEFVTSQELGELIPAEPAAYINFGSLTGKDTLQAAIASFLPRSCRIDTAQTLFSSTGTQGRPSLASLVGGLLDEATRGFQDVNSTESIQISDFPLVNLASLVRGSTLKLPLAILDFRDEVLPVQASRLDKQDMFNGTNSTYWIVGMTGALGVSLCDWMISKGARNIALTSRKPDVAVEWVESHKKRGVTVAVMPCDITIENDLKVVYNKLREALRPIAGVISGAMVLRDVAIRNMEFEQLTDVTQPKVGGSIHLDRLFHATPLDFFVLVSSVNCVIGSWGQANYAAANMFMCGLAAARRHRGLRASVVNAGAIIGAGYIERESRRALDAIVQKLHMMRLSEDDWHQAICEAIDASRLDSAHGPEITMGLSLVPSDIPVGPTWLSNPKFAGFILDVKPDAAKKEHFETTSSVEHALQSCVSKQDLYDTVTKAFAMQLRVMLQMVMSNDDLMASRSNEIGLDSLVSVDIRSWFLKNFQVNIPTLKVMGNNTMASLVEFAVEAIITSNPSQIDSASDTNMDTSTTTQDNDSLKSLEESSEARTTSECDSPASSPPINWASEAAPQATWTSVSYDAFSNPPSTTPKVIVLTGVTGLLGRCLLKHILRYTVAAKIHCLAVRGVSRRLHNKEMLMDSRVEYHEGKLENPLLGLSEDECRSIFTTADAVIHIGADTSHTKPYSDMRASNVGSTRTLVELCLPRRIPFHYVSSAGVAIYQDQAEFPEISLAAAAAGATPPTSGTFGYGCTKWVNERLLEQLHARGADADATRHPHAALDWVNTLLRYIRVLRAAPRTAHNRGALDLVRLETCCRDIMANLLQTGEQREEQRQPQYVHSAGDAVLAVDRLHEIDVEAGGQCYDVLSMGEWTRRAMAAGMHPGVALLIERMDAPEQASYPKLLRARSD
ncbi:Polyketide synthase [Apiospora phragmitis]|uniref:Polyketide synthase n=1 Tax=Apiospora phragmitis TaxID=2905665 RepID=A0ABR1UJV8_9PEZI